MEPGRQQALIKISFHLQLLTVNIWIAFFLNLFLIFIYLFFVFKFMWTNRWLVPKLDQKAVTLLELELRAIVSQWDGSWKLNPDPL